MKKSKSKILSKQNQICKLCKIYCLRNQFAYKKDGNHSPYCDTICRKRTL